MKLAGALIVLAAAGAAAGISGAALYASEDPILFQSEESSAPEHGPILNRIQWISEPDYDLWVMQQNQALKSHAFERWDRLAILVDKTKSPNEARFYQLAPGPLAPSLADLRHEREFKVSCGNCHVNGPRALRPVFAFNETYDETPAATLGLRDFARAQLWNLRIKTYGRIQTRTDDQPRRMPFNFPGTHAALKVKACTICHNESKWGRGPLTRAQASTIDFMIKKGHMPPPGLPLSDEGRIEIEKFTAGFWAKSE